jgi:hypothetical protein
MGCAAGKRFAEVEHSAHLGGGYQICRRGDARIDARILFPERDDHFVGARDVELLAHQLVDHVGIGAALRIEQVDAVLDLGALLGERGIFDVLLRQFALNFLRRDDAVGPSTAL